MSSDPPLNNKYRSYMKSMDEVFFLKQKRPESNLLEPLLHKKHSHLSNEINDTFI